MSPVYNGEPNNGTYGISKNRRGRDNVDLFGDLLKRELGVLICPFRRW